MAGNAINAKSEALELHELSSEELDAVSGGDLREQAKQDDRKMGDQIKAFQQMLQELP
jgi:hypothetical protein